MNIKELIEKAVENLNRIRQLNLNVTGIASQLDNDNVFLVSILDNESDSEFYVVINENIVTQQLLPDDSQNLSPDNIIMLRIAKHIFEAYKKSKNNIINGSSILNSGQTISTLKIGGNACDISVKGKSLTVTIDKVDELKNKVKDLEDTNHKLICEIDDLKTILRAKGIL